jgi:hypothetical protein
MTDDADEARMSEIRNKLRRIDGHKDLSAKQFESLKSLTQELAALEGIDSVDDIFK